jgi:hypothetical protein
VFITKSISIDTKLLVSQQITVTGSKMPENIHDRRFVHIDHLLWNHGPRLTFVRGALTDYFFPGRRINAVYTIGMIAMIGYVQGGSLSAGLSRLVSGRYVHEIVHSYAHVQADQVDF